MAVHSAPWIEAYRFQAHRDGRREAAIIGVCRLEYQHIVAWVRHGGHGEQNCLATTHGYEHPVSWHMETVRRIVRGPCFLRVSNSS